MTEKASWTPVQRKMESQLVHASKTSRGETFAAGVPNLEMDVKFQPDGRILVDIDCTVTPELLNLIAQDGGTVLNSLPQFDAIHALVTVAQLETIAARTEVRFVRRAAEPFTNTGSVDSEGDTTHRAIAARSTFNAFGTGITVGVLSDSCDHYTNSQATGDLPNPIVILPGQSGIPGTGEGTAMMEIVHDLAPNSPLQFASAFTGEAQFAQNIINLWSNGCNIIVDDVGYFDEPPFQDGVVARAVNTVTTGGALYFSSAANSGNLDDGTSGTWEGDFVNGGAVTFPESGQIHNFGGQNYDACISGGSSRRVDLFWSDPWGASCNDYDLFVLDSTGATVLRSSIAFQTCTQNPYESVGTLNVGERIVIVLFNGSGRFIHLSTGRGQLGIATSGATVGHSAATNAFSTAAVDVHTTSPFPSAFTGGAANPFETFTSDGFRHVFFNADGSAMTPGNFSSTGGAIRNKPDIAAADGVSTSVPGFAPFYGTSAAAPHAAAIAAMLWSVNNSLSPAQIRNILINSALDVNPVGYDRDTGYGIVMAYNAIHAMAPANDTCAGATLVNSIYYFNSQSTVFADSTGDPSPSCIYQPGHGVWYQFTPPISGQFQIDTIGSSFDTCLGIYTGSCGAWTQIACDDDSGGNLTSKITLNLTAGTTYYILAGGYNGANGNLNFSVNYIVPVNTAAVQASYKGWYDSTGYHDPANANYYCGEDSISGNLFRNFFVFYVPAFNIKSAQLVLHAYQVATPYGSLAYQLSDVTTPVGTLVAGGSGLTGIYTDLGNGASYGYRSITPADANTTITIPLNPAFVSAAAAANGGYISLGGAFTNLNGTTIGDEYAFSYSQGLPDDAILELTYDTSGQVNASYTGWYQASGFHNPANANYYTGGTNHSFFVFNVPYFSTSVVNAELLVNCYSNASTAPTANQTMLLRDVTTPIATLVAGGSGLTSIYADLGDGTVYGVRNLAVSESGMRAIIPLNASFINALMSSQGGQIALGGSITVPITTDTDYLFGYSLGNVGDVQLRLTFGPTFLVNANARGWYDNTGYHDPGNSNYIAGAQGTTTWHDFFVFPVPFLNAQVVNAQLLLNSYTEGSSTGGPYAFQRYSLHDVTTPIPSLEAGGSGLTAIFNDLANGADYGERYIYTNETGFVSAIPLSSTFRQAAQSASGGQIALGGSLPDLTSSSTLDFLFGFSGGGASSAQLFLGLASNWPNSPVLQPPFRHLGNGNFQFSVNGTAPSYEIDVTTNLKDWDVLGSLNMTNTTSVFTDTGTTGIPYRYYRARLVP